MLFFSLLHHQGDVNHITLMMEIELFSETVDFIIRLTRLSAREDFIDFVTVKSENTHVTNLYGYFTINH
jgi:hypothetical protein